MKLLLREPKKVYNVNMQAGAEVFTARLNGVKVYDPNGDHVGRVRDIVLILSVGTNSRAIGFVVEVYAKRLIFVPLSRVSAISTTQIVISGLLNMKRFQKRELEILGYTELLDRAVNLGNQQAKIEDFAITLQQNGDWQISKYFVQIITESKGITGFLNKKGETKFADPRDVDLSLDTENRGTNHLVESIEGLKPADAADVLLDLDERRQFEVAQDLDDERLAEVLEEMPESDQIQLLENFETERIADVLEEMEPDDAADLLGKMDKFRQRELLEEMEAEEAEDVRQLLEYGPNTAGGMMTTNPIVLTSNTTVALALAQIRRPELPPSLASLVFVTQQPNETPTGRFLGVLHFQQLLRYPPHSQLGNLLDTDICFVYPNATVDEVSRVFAMYNSMAIPVLDRESRLLGAISVDDVLDHILPENWREKELVNGGRYGA